MTPAAMAALHARCFTRPRPWTAAGFAAVLDSPGAFAVTGDAGFAIGRALAGEAELLTLAVDPGQRRQGHGRRLLAAFEAAAAARGATRALLEVASDNAGAQALYAAAGWHVAGRRRGYYAPGVDAIILDKALTAA